MHACRSTLEDPTVGVTLRTLATAADHRACLALQREVWGPEFVDMASPAVLRIALRLGGVAAGAFDGDGRLLGFVFGLTGPDVRGDGRLVHWSHMLAVRPAARDLGLGRRLKLFQRELLLPLGVEEVLWTFDPLEARNAHLNLNRLGAQPVELVAEMYAEDRGSELARGLGGGDRFVLSWRLASERVEAALAGRLPREPERFAEAPVVNAVVGESGRPEPVERDLPDAPLVRVEIPADVQALKVERPDEALRWRTATRRALAHYLARGYRVEAVLTDRASGRCFYALAL